MLVAKMHGAGNDFVVVAEAPPSPGEDAAFVRALADRRRGIGADGVLFLEETPDLESTLRMHFYNCDGGRAGLCLNGARCAALRAVQLGWTDAEAQIRTEHSSVRARVGRAGDAAEVELVLPFQETQARPVDLPPGSPAVKGWSVHTGDPHLVLEVDDLEEFAARARPLRWWKGPDPDGSNVHFVRRGAQEWAIRSFERGIEGETLACGSGCVSALLALGTDRAALRTHAGDLINVRRSPDGIVLTGPAVCVFTTEWPADATA